MGMKPFATSEKSCYIDLALATIMAHWSSTNAYVDCYMPGVGYFMTNVWLLGLKLSGDVPAYLRLRQAQSSRVSQRFESLERKDLM